MGCSHLGQKDLKIFASTCTLCDVVLRSYLRLKLFFFSFIFDFFFSSRRLGLARWISDLLCQPSDSFLIWQILIVDLFLPFSMYVARYLVGLDKMYLVFFSGTLGWYWYCATRFMSATLLRRTVWAGFVCVGKFSGLDSLETKCQCLSITYLPPAVWLCRLVVSVVSLPVYSVTEDVGMNRGPTVYLDMCMFITQVCMLLNSRHFLLRLEATFWRW